MSPSELKDKILSSDSCLHFRYKGEIGIVHTYTLKSFNLFYKYDSKMFNSIEALMADDFFEGKSLIDISQNITLLTSEQITNLDIILCILDNYSCATFDYNGEHCGVDPYSSCNYLMWYGQEKDYNAKSVEEVINYKLFDGKSIKEIADEVKIWWEIISFERVLW